MLANDHETRLKAKIMLPLQRRKKKKKRLAGDASEMMMRGRGASKRGRGKPLGDSSHKTASGTMWAIQEGSPAPPDSKKMHSKNKGHK